MDYTLLRSDDEDAGRDVVSFGGVSGWGVGRAGADGARTLATGGPTGAVVVVEGLPG